MDFAFDSDLSRTAFCSGNALGRTGVVVEALTAVRVCLLTICDMCMSADRGMVIEGVRLLEKHGGKPGSFIAGD